MQDFLTLLSQTDIPEITQVQGWLQIGTSLGFGGLVWYLITVALPNMQARFDKHSDNQMEAFAGQVEKITTHSEKQLERVLTHYEKQRG